MRVSQLGIVVDASGAKKGADETRRALEGVATSAASTTAAVTQSFEQQVKAQQRAAAEANRAANEERRRAAAAREAAEIRRREAEAAEAAAARVAAAEERKARAMALAEMRAYEMDAAMARATKGALGTDAGMNRLRGSLTALLAPIAQTNGAVNTFTSTLLSLGPGNTVAVGVIAGIGAIAGAWQYYQSSTEQARKATEDAIKSLTDLQRKQQEGATGATPAQIATALREQAKAQRELVAAEAELRRVRVAPDYAAAKIGTGAADAQAADIARAAARVRALQDQIASGQREVTRILNETNADYSRGVTEQLATLVRGGNATVAEQQRLKERLANRKAELDRLTTAGGDAAARAKLIAEIKTITDAYDAQGKAAEKSARDGTNATTEALRNQERFSEFVRKGKESLERQREEQEKATAKIRDANDAIAGQFSTRAKDMDILREEIKALSGQTNAYEDLTRAKFAEKAVAEARAKLPKDASLDPMWELGIRAQALAFYDLAKAKAAAEKRQEIIKNWDGRSPFTIPDDSAQKARELADGIRDAVDAASALAGMFGEVGKNIGAAVSAIGKMSAAYERLKTVKPADAAVNATGNGFGAFSASAGPVLTIAATFVAFGNKMMQAQREDADRRNALQRDFAQAVATFAKSIADSGLSAFQKSQQDLGDKITELVTKAYAASGARLSTVAAGAFTPDADGLRQLQASARATLGVNAKDAAALKAFADALDAVIAQAEAGAKALRERAAADLKSRTDDARVALLVAQGRTGEAEAMRRQLELQRQIDAATKEFAGLDGLEAYIALLKEADAAAAAAAAAEKQRQGAAFGLDLTARRQTLSGDDRGAMITRQTISNNSALAQAAELVKAGTITAAMFEELKVILGEELTKAIADFDAAVAKAKQTQIDDLAVRALVAQGKSAEAEQLRIEIANRNELVGVTDETVRAEILRVQGLEAEARAQAAATAAAEEAARAARTYSDAMLSINERIANALRAVNPELAKQLDAANQEIRRAKELADATDDAMRAKLRYLYAIEDEAAAQTALAESLNSAAQAAKDLANFSDDLKTRWLRATGRTFEASVNELNNWRDNAKKNAAAVGLGNDPLTNQMIDETYAGEYAKLVKDTMDAATEKATATRADVASAAAEKITALGGESSVLRGAQSITETSAMRLVDYAASQLAVQRDILAELRGRQAGSGADRLLGTASASGLDQWLGTAASDQSRLVYGTLA